MIRGIYAAASGMTFQMNQVDAIANNIANVETNGYKRSQLIPEAFGNLVVQMAGGNAPPASLSEGVRSAELARFDTPGNVRATGNPLNLAITGPGYFLVQQPSGRVVLTRDGDFNLDANQRLVTKAGDLVLDTRRRPLTIPGLTNQIEIQQDGTVVSNGLVGARIMVVAPTQAQLASFPVAPAGIAAAPPATVDVRQGFLEDSNVNVVTELVQLLEAEKLFNFDQKAVTTQDQELQKATSQLGQVNQ